MKCHIAIHAKYQVPHRVITWPKYDEEKTRFDNTKA
jgi:hypothetical protein